MLQYFEKIWPAIKKKWRFILGTVLLACSWGWVNLWIDPANEEKADILEKLKHIATFPPLIDGDVTEINQVKLNKSRLTDSAWRANMTNVDHQFFLTLWAAKGALLILRAKDDSASEVNDILWNDSVGLGAAVENQDAGFLQGHIAAFQQFSNQWVVPVHKKAVERIAELSKRVEGSHYWILILVIAGTVLINLDKIKEFLHQKEERRESVVEIVKAMGLPIAPVDAPAPHLEPNQHTTRAQRRAADRLAAKNNPSAKTKK